MPSSPGPPRWRSRGSSAAPDRSPGSAWRLPATPWPRPSRCSSASRAWRRGTSAWRAIRLRSSAAYYRARQGHQRVGAHILRQQEAAALVSTNGRERSSRLAKARLCITAWSGRPSPRSDSVSAASSSSLVTSQGRIVRRSSPSPDLRWRPSASRPDTSAPASPLRGQTPARRRMPGSIGSRSPVTRASLPSSRLDMNLHCTLALQAQAGGGWVRDRPWISLPAHLRQRRRPGARRHAGSQGPGTVEDLLAYVPFRYEDRSNMKTVAQLAPGEMATVIAEVRSAKPLRLQAAQPGMFEARFTDSLARHPGGQVVSRRVSGQRAAPKA
jgi:hypothetical protein